MKLVYCIIVTYNGMKWISKCLESLHRSSYPLTILIIDNASEDQTVPFIKEHYPSLKIVESGINLGFGQANNIGLKMAINNNADHVFLVNQDVYIEPDTIQTLVDLQSRHTAFGILSPLHLNGDGNGFDINFLHYFLASDIKPVLENQYLQKNNFQPILNTPFVNAAAWMISKDCLKSTGGFDPIFFHYGEDDNYAQRVLHKGFKIGIAHGAKICHDRSSAFHEKSNDVRIRIKKDWILFLNQVCDIHNGSYGKLMIRRMIRYQLLLIYSIISGSKNNTRYYSSMIKKTVSAIPAIKASRSISLRKDIVPHIN